MTWEPKRRTWDWREHLTAEEMQKVEKLDREKVVLDKRRREITQTLGPIVNRAIQRARLRARQSQRVAADA